eukprot:gb/GFBE01022841.1/.p1 GENE.gb/GFBE01022841.1/~~gb/GFBE01022841.1/.p1  ORF type:complete len:1087 (+),score=281.03 gb/GFBE01022841.1/:1-3261(+)
MATASPATQEMQLMPWTAVLCLVYAALTLVLLLVALLQAGVSNRWENPDSAELSHAASAVLLIVSALIAEVGFIVASRTSIDLLEIDAETAGRIQRGRGDSWLTVLEYMVKFTCGLTIAFGGGGFVHTDTLAFGEPRPVYMGRFMQWSIGIPILSLIGVRSFLAQYPAGVVARRFGPNALATFLFVWAAWINQVTTNHVFRWPLLVTSILGYVVVSIDLVHLICQHRHATLFAEKACLNAYTIVASCVYAVVFLLGRFGLLSSFGEQVFYAYADATVHILQGALLAMIRQWEDAGELRKWWMVAESTSKELGALVDSACVPILSVDSSGIVTQWNSSMEKLSGLSCEAATGRLLVELVSPDGKDSLQKEVDTMAASKPVKPSEAGTTQQASSQDARRIFELCFTTKDQLPRKLAMVFAPKFKDGVQVGANAIGYDLSELAHLQTVQEQKSALMAVLSHEIRSPLHGMLGLTTALLEPRNGKPVENEKQLGMVKGCAARLLDLVTNIMELAQGEKQRSAGIKAERPAGPVNITAIADEAITMLTSSVDKANKPLLKPSIRLINEVGPEPLFRGNHYKVTQLIYNLLTNACKFTEQGTISIAARYDEAAELLMVDVIDTGKGISKEAQARIFQPFAQENSGDTRNFQGIGLGLSVCKEIVEMHGGSLSVKSQLGKGSTFTATFPCDGKMGWAEKVEDAPAKPKTPATTTTANPGQTSLASPKTSPTTASRRPTILSVDDDEVNQEVIKSTLGDLYDITIAMDGFQALAVLEEAARKQDEFPDLVLLDIQMPGLTGYAVCEEIRKRFVKDLSALPITMISAKAPSEDAAVQGYESGSTDFISKPFKKELLLQKVAAAIQMKREMKASVGVSVVASECKALLEKVEAERCKVEDEKADLLRDLAKTKAELDETQKRFQQQARELEQLEMLTGTELLKPSCRGASSGKVGALRVAAPSSPAPGQLALRNKRLTMHSLRLLESRDALVKQFISARQHGNVHMARMSFVACLAEQSRKMLAMHGSELCPGLFLDGSEKERKEGSSRVLLDAVDSHLQSIIEQAGIADGNWPSDLSMTTATPARSATCEGGSSS